MLSVVDATDAIDRGHRHPEEVRELAYQLWAFVASRNAKEVARLLSTQDYGDYDVPARTVQYWASSDSWAVRANDDLHKLAPDLMYQTISEYRFGALEGARYVRRVNQGLEDHADISDILNDDSLNFIDKRLKINARVRGHDSARKARLQAAIASRDAIGLSPVGKGSPSIAKPFQHSDDVDVSVIDDDQLTKRESHIGAGRPG